MPPAHEYDGLIIDANCCIKSTLNFNLDYNKKHVTIGDADSPALKAFIYSRPVKKLVISYYPLTKEESYRNLTRAVNDLFVRNGIKSEYVIGKYIDEARKKLNVLFSDKLMECEEKCADSDVQDVRSFFISVEKDVCMMLQLQHAKPNIPEEADCKLIACICRENWTKRAIVSGDSHFEAYMAEICSKFRIYVFPTKNLIQIMRNWGWSF